ncbi:MAG: hypothetical protein H6744_09605 [Deltaproteobacteria bacterium]|nr:hypothetical protein [Deltaproteobacteria bacterium]
MHTDTSSGLRARATVLALAFACAAAYVVGALTLGELFPFSRFRMFSERYEHGARLLVHDADGSERRLPRVGAEACGPFEPQLSSGAGAPDGCVSPGDAAAATAGSATTILRREYRFLPAGSTRLERHDCVVAACSTPPR